MAVRHLRVIGRQLPVENQNVFMRSERHFFSVEKAGGISLLPDQVIAKVTLIAANQLTGKRLCRHQNDCRVWLSYSLQLVPHFGKRDRVIPTAFGGTVWRVGQNHIDGTGWDLLHNLDAVALM